MPDGGLTGLILAGGESRRMGTAKALLPWGRTTLIEHVIETLRPCVDELIVAVRDAQDVPRLDARVVEDLVPGAHALGGLYTGLRMASHDRLFVCACDAPFLNPRLIRLLCAQANGFDAVIPQTATGLQPLHAVYTPACLPAIAEQLRLRQWDLKSLVTHVRAKIVEVDVVRQLDPEGLSVCNLNTPQEYQAACALRERLV